MWLNLNFSLLSSCFCQSRACAATLHLCWVIPVELFLQLASLVPGACVMINYVFFVVSADDTRGRSGQDAKFAPGRKCFQNVGVKKRRNNLRCCICDDWIGKYIVHSKQERYVSKRIACGKKF